MNRTLSRKAQIGIVSLLAFFCTLVLYSPCNAWWGRVIGVEAGDLLVVSNDNQTQQIKLYGVNCPERGQPSHEKARALVAHLTSEQRVEVTPLYKGNDGFERALVRIDGTKDYLNHQLVAYGMAWVKPDECSFKVCAEWKEIEKLAGKKWIGLWEDLNPIPPWEWRKVRWKIMQEQKESAKNFPASK